MKTPGTQHGFGIVTTIFIIVILALLAVFMVTMATTQRATSTLSLLGPRAYFAAQSGTEWAIARVLATGTCIASPTTFTLTGGMTNGFTIRITCSATAISEGTDNYSVFRLQTLASLGAPTEEDYFSRTLDTTVTNAP